MDPVVERSVDLDVEPDDVWRALTEPDELAAWFGPEVELDVRPGGHGRFVDDEGCARRAVVDHVQAGERLAVTGASLRAAADAARTAWMWRLDVLLLRVAALARV